MLHPFLAARICALGQFINSNRRIIHHSDILFGLEKSPLPDNTHTKLINLAATRLLNNIRNGKSDKLHIDKLAFSCHRGEGS